jgi:guanylate kinase
MTRKIRFGEIENIDSVFLTEEEFKSNFSSGKYIQETLESTYFSSSYYGCPKQWLDVTSQGQFSCFVSPTVMVAKKLKEELGDKVFWIHLIANKETLLQRMNGRQTKVDDKDFEQRIDRAIASVNVDGNDLVIDTSNLNAWEIFFQALVKI